jgi:S1-C subfamily serine protease
MKRLFFILLATTWLLALTLAYQVAAAQDLTVPALVKIVEPCIYRVEVQGTALKTVPDGPNEREVEVPFASVGTGFTVPFLHLLGLVAPSPLLLEKFFPKKEPGLTKLQRFGKMHRVGYVATNSHVVWPIDMKLKSSPTIQLRSQFGSVLNGELAGHDPESDLAVIKVTVNDAQLFDDVLPSDRRLFDENNLLKTLNFADATQLQVGQDVVAIGFAHGLEGLPTVTRGIISALERSQGAGRFSGLIQTDASINHGNSGGPLLNLRGEVVGVNTYAYPDRLEVQFDAQAFRKLLDENQDDTFVQHETTVVRRGPVLAIGQPLNISRGVHFARSSATAHPLVEQLIRSEKVHRPDLGIVPVVVDTKRVEDLYFEVGVIIAESRANSLAASAGLRPGDVITDLAKFRIRNVGDLNNALALLPSLLSKGEPIRVRYVRPSAVVIEALIQGKTSFDNLEEVAKALRDRRVKETTILLPN